MQASPPKTTRVGFFSALASTFVSAFYPPDRALTQAIMERADQTSAESAKAIARADALELQAQEALAKSRRALNRSK